MNERRRPRSRGQAPADAPTPDAGELNPYRDESGARTATADGTEAAPPRRRRRSTAAAADAADAADAAPPADASAPAPAAEGAEGAEARPARRPRTPRVPRAPRGATAGADPTGDVVIEGAASFGGDAPARDVGREAPREQPGDATREAPREQPREAFRDEGGGGGGPREGGREFAREGQMRDAGRDAGREGAREFRRGRRRRGRGAGPHAGAPGQAGAPGGGHAPREGYREGPPPAPQNGQGAPYGGPYQSQHQQGGPRDRDEFRRGRRQRQRGRQPREFGEPRVGGGGAVVADTEVTGWLDIGREGGFVRQAANSYLPAPGDAFVPNHIVRQFTLRKGDLVTAAAGRDHRGRAVVTEIRTLNGAEPQPEVKRPDFQALLATYPERKLTLETGKPAKGGPELTRRVVDLIAPIGFGQRALIVAPARSGKTMLLQAIVEGVAVNHPDAALIVLLVDERPEEVSEMVQVGYGEVVASSFDMPAERHREVVEMVMERSRRLVEQNKDVVIVLDSITRMARAFNASRGIGRTLSGGLDANAMQTPKAFFGSARAVAASSGGGSLTIIGTALVETGSRMDDVIFEEFKGTGNCEIKLDRGLAEQRLFPAIDIPASGTRREDKLFRPDQLDAVFILRRGLQQMPSSAAITWLTKRIGNTRDNDVLLATLKDA
jgi:transcription termination factor Rho